MMTDFDPDDPADVRRMLSEVELENLRWMQEDASDEKDDHIIVYDHDLDLVS